jgi:hypothetical protein
VAGFYFFQLLSKSGLLSRLAYRLGLVGSIRDFPDLVQEPYGIGLVAAHAFLATPFFTLHFGNLYVHERAGELVQVARTLGASAWQSARRVVVPLLLLQPGRIPRRVRGSHPVRRAGAGPGTAAAAEAGGIVIRTLVIGTSTFLVQCLS